MAREIRIAAAQYPIDWLPSFEAWQAKLARWVHDAAGEGANLLVFPEYGSMELASVFGAEVAGDLHGSLTAMSSLLAQVEAEHAALASRFGVHIVAGSFPVKGQDGRFRNVARLFAPNGKVGIQEKLMMTRFEREDWHIAAGGPARVFDTTIGRIGISICYDVEFPLIARTQAEAAAEIILSPSSTERLAGYWRVRIGAQARALENQCYAIQSPTVGNAAWSPAIGTTHGAAGVYGPPDIGFPENGIVAMGELDKAQWLYATLDLDKVAAVRADGGVLNHKHWPEQGGAPVLPAEIINLK